MVRNTATEALGVEGGVDGPARTHWLNRAIRHDLDSTCRQDPLGPIPGAFEAQLICLTGTGIAREEHNRHDNGQLF
jgi:hypothetical protein